MCWPGSGEGEGFVITHINDRPIRSVADLDRVTGPVTYIRRRISQRARHQLLPLCSRELPRGTIREKMVPPTQESHCGAGSVFKTPTGGKERRDNVLFYIATNNMRQLKITKSITNRESASLDKYASGDRQGRPYHR